MATLVQQITELLRTTMADLWQDGGSSKKYPYDSKTPRRTKKPHALDSAFRNNPSFMISPEMMFFEIGNPEAEAETPHYHILEDAKIIRHPNMSTKRSRGSQGLIKDVSKRDYSVLAYGERKKEVVQEYRNPKAKYSEQKGGFRENIYYQYIEKLVLESGQNVASVLKLKFTTSKDDTIAVGDLTNITKKVM
jgi:hypothetical protein